MTVPSARDSSCLGSLSSTLKSVSPRLSATLRNNDICSRSRKKNQIPSSTPSLGPPLPDPLNNSSCLSSIRGIARLSHSKRLVSDPCQHGEMPAPWLTNSPTQLGFPEQSTWASSSVVTHPYPVGSSRTPRTAPNLGLVLPARSASSLSVCLSVIGWVILKCQHSTLLLQGSDL